MSDLDIKDIDQNYERLRCLVRETAILNWQGSLKEQYFGDESVYLKLEFLQHSGSFKVRGAFSAIYRNLERAKKNGVVAVSRGNHGCAVAYAASFQGISSKIVVPRDVNKRRLTRCRNFGSEVVFAQDVAECFSLANEIQEKEGRFFIHPFEGESIALGTAGVAKEFHDQVAREGGQLEEIYVACGGGGLLAGVSAYSKQMVPHCAVFGVEPTGASAMAESLKRGQPTKMAHCRSIADSLVTPSIESYSFGLCQKYADDIILVDDEEILETTKLLYNDLSLVLEPSGVAALTGAVKRSGRSKKSLGIVLCGANIDLDHDRSFFL